MKINEDKIVKGFKKFDEQYESLEIPPYNVAYDYYKAGYKCGVEDEDKELLIDWFETIASILNEKFPTRFNESLDGHRGSEIDAVNDVVAKCSNCVEYIKKFM